MKRILFIITAIFTLFATRAQSVDSIRELIDGGNYPKAIDDARQALETDTRNVGTLNALLGEAMYLSGQPVQAEEALRKATAKGVADAYRWLGRMAYDRYDFNTASSDYARYFEMKKKASKPVSDAAVEEQSRLADAKRYFSRVENIQVIDSLRVPRDGFFLRYRLPADAGSLLSRENVPLPDADDAAAMVFANERDDMRIWARRDSVGMSRLAQSLKLSDGAWGSPEFLDSVLNIGNLDFPFMTPDGMTLYFASDGPASIGGLDIFMATRDPADDSYRIPQNIGMPYNSPYDDFMLAIDETNNVGWWATDRNAPEGEVTIYIFIPNEIRENYPEDTENLRSLARLDAINQTWPDDAYYVDILETINSIDPTRMKVTEDFRFPLPDGTTLSSWGEIDDEDTREDMENYLQTAENLQATLGQLDTLRREYHSRRSPATADSILGLEKTVDAYYRSLRQQRNSLVRRLQR